MARLIRIAQPPVNPSQRPTEQHDFWPGFVAAVIAVVLVICGAGHLTGVETMDGNTARETQLVKAFSSGGLEFPGEAPAPPPPPPDDPVAAAAALERWQRELAHSTPPNWKVRVNTEAKAACPT